MSILELVKLLSEFYICVIIYLVLIPLLALLLRLGHGKYRAKRSPWKYMYSVLIYLTCVPGIFSLVITVYSLLFLHANLLDVNVFVYYLPLVSMALTLTIVQKSVAFEDIPGFGKINGLILLLALTFIIMLALERFRLFVIFRGSGLLLLIVAAVIFFLLKYSIRAVLGIRKK